MVAEYLKTNQYQLISQNFWTRCGEIDIIAWDHKESVLVFVEVKNYETIQIDPRSVIRSTKKRNFWNTAELFLLKNPRYQDKDCRFDLVVVKQQQVEDHYMNITLK